MDSQVSVEGNGRFNHTTCGHISNQGRTGKRARRVCFVAINDVLEAADEDAQDTVPEHDTGSKWGPIGGPRIIRLSHPEHANRDGRGSQHGEPQPEFRWKLGPALLFDLCKIILCPLVNNGYKE